MILRRLAASIRRQDWTTVAIEFLIVVVGILFALQVDQWVGERAERTLEREYLERLVSDLAIERQRMVAAVGFAENRLEAIRLLDDFAANSAAAEERPGAMPWALETATWRSFPKVNAFVFRELQSTGNLTLIRSVALRRALSQHYAQIEHDARVGEDLSAQHRFEAATAGLVTIDELIAVENADGRRDQIDIEPVRARDLAEAFASRPTAVAQLPSLAQHHAFNVKVIGDMLARTDALIEQINSLLATGRALQ